MRVKLDLRWSSCLQNMQKENQCKRASKKSYFSKLKNSGQAWPVLKNVGVGVGYVIIWMFIVCNLVGFQYKTRISVCVSAEHFQQSCDHTVFEQYRDYDHLTFHTVPCLILTFKLTNVILQIVYIFVWYRYRLLTVFLNVCRVGSTNPCFCETEEGGADDSPVRLPSFEHRSQVKSSMRPPKSWAVKLPISGKGQW